MRKGLMLTDDTVSFKDVICPFCPLSQVHAEITNLSGYSYQAQLQPAILSKISRKEKET